jgi:predicted alpha/beta-fold hydrolase
MPLIQSTSYTSPIWLYNGHLQTIIPSLFRKVRGVPFKRERIATIDDDFLDLDWLKSGNEKLVIISHGLEGDSQRPYVKGMAKVFHAAGWDVVAWNFRGCSGEVNKNLRFYHSGATDDLHAVASHALDIGGYKQVAMIGFSLGGNLTLKYLGEDTAKLPQQITGAAVFSVPLHLHGSSRQIAQRGNRIYSRRFLKKLKQKVEAKSLAMPNQLTMAHFENIRSLEDFDDFYTAPLHGFENAQAYYEACSAIRFIDKINVPTLIVNAANDPFLSPECYPTEQVKGHPYVHLEIPAEGGHCGFPLYNAKGMYWSEIRALEFLESQM